MSKLKRLLSLFFGVVLMSVTSSCSALSQLGGQTIRQTFTDEKVVVLVEAAVAGESKKVAQLAAQGVDVNAVGNNGATPLIWALSSRNKSGVAALLRANANPNLRAEKIGDAPMYFVSMGDDPELLRLLLEHGGDPNHLGRGRIEERPLTQATAKGRIENIKLLLAAGADINAHDSFEESAATSAIDSAQFEAIALLLERGYTYNISYLARGVQIRHVPPESDAQRWKDKVIVMLKERGVTTRK
ncbi:MAG: ankyrin repeat domain-containing protein [Pseudomonadota bacterium]